MSMIPKGGNTIWGGLDWSPEEGYCPGKREKDANVTTFAGRNNNPETKKAYYGRMISFGKDVAEASQSDIKKIDFRVSIFLQLFPNFNHSISYLTFMSLNYTSFLSELIKTHLNFKLKIDLVTPYLDHAELIGSELLDPYPNLSKLLSE